MNFNKLHSFLFTCLIITTVHAQQPVLTSDEMLPYGSSLSFRYVSDLSVIDTTIQGANVEWDFSGIESLYNSDDLFLEIVDPADTPYGSNFPNANYAYKEGPETAYRYFILDDDELQRVGSWSDSGLNTYTDPQTEYIFPLQLGAANNDDWDNTSSSFGGSYNIKCIGYGTLKLSNVTYEDVLLVRIKADELFDFDVYFWYSSKNGISLLEYVVGDGFFIGSFGVMLSELSTTTSTEDLTFIERINYNNPIGDMLDIDIYTKEISDIQYRLLDVNGRSFFINKLSANAENYHQLQLDMSQYSSGMYFLQFTSEEGMQTIKLIKS